MSGIETVGGCCPNCSKVLHQKFESSGCGSQFDACVFCGFYCDGDVFEKEDAAELFAILIRISGVSTIEELQKKYSNYEADPALDDFYPTLFKYESDEISGRILDFDSVDWNEELKKLLEPPKPNDLPLKPVNAESLENVIGSEMTDSSDGDKDNIPF